MGESNPLGVLLDHAQDIVVLLDDDGTITYANDATKRMLGYDSDAVVGQVAFDLIHPADTAATRAAFERLLDADEIAENTVTHRIQAMDGSWVWLESRMSNLSAEVLDGYVVSSRDVTDRVAAERDRAATATRLEELAATTGDVLWMFTADWSEVLFVNSAYEDVYGGCVERLREEPQSFLETIHHADVPRVKSAMERLSAGESVEIEYRVAAPAAEASWVWVQAEPIFEDGEVARITGFTRDVTNRRRRERQLYVLDTLLRHNLRNDLTIVLGEAERIAEESPAASDHTDVIRETARGLLASAEKGREIVDLLTTEHPRCDVDVARTVEAVADEVAPRFPEATIDVDAPASAVAFAVDGHKVAFVELLENAIEHSAPSEPRVDVTVTETGDRVVVTVADAAPPLPDEEAAVLTGDSEMHDVYHSSGLGLWLVYWLVELSNGEITVESTSDGNRIELAFERANA